AVRMPLRRLSNANGHHHVAHEADRVGVDVRARTADARSAVGWRRRVERRYLGILEEVLVTLEIEFESDSVAEIAGRYARAPFAPFDVAGDVPSEVRRDRPLRACGRGGPHCDRHGEQDAASKSQD